MVPGPARPTPGSARRSSTSIRGPAPPSRCSTPTGRWRRSAGAALVGSGGPAGAAVRRRSGDWSVCYELLSLSARDGYRGTPINTVPKRAASGSLQTDPDSKNLCFACFHIASAPSSRGSRCQTEVRKCSHYNWLLARPKRFELLTPRFVV